MTSRPAGVSQRHVKTPDSAILTVVPMVPELGAKALSVSGVATLFTSRQTLSRCADSGA